MNILIPCLWAAGGVQLAMAGLNFFLPKRLDYAGNLPRLSPIVRQVFVVHSVYIVLVLAGASALCLCFAPFLASGSAEGRAPSGFFAVFWSLRVLIQLFYYDRRFLRENRIAAALMAMAFIYLAVVFAGAAAKV